MADLNNYSVIGRMTRDLDDNGFGYTPNGKARLNIAIAVNDGYGENQYTSYFDVVIWGKTAENIRPYIGKGKQLCINGRLRQDRWTGNDGAKHSRVVIVAETVQLLGGRDNAAGSGENYQQQPAPAAEPAQDQTDYSADFPEDIPF
ncbi:MAG: single-stranded DNA-binding protein [Clostridia bacterium]|nr:single-stranded DNA-binding protein [Clostridia bacterium]